MRRGFPRIGPDDLQAIAVLLAIVWAFGTLLAPAIHLARHDALEAHSHRVAGRDAVDHDHPERPGEHGEGSLEHQAVAALRPAPIIAPIGAAPIAALLAIVAPDEPETHASVALPPARGPPRTS